MRTHNKPIHEWNPASGTISAHRFTNHCKHLAAVMDMKLKWWSSRRVWYVAVYCRSTRNRVSPRQVSKPKPDWKFSLAKAPGPSSAFGPWHHAQERSVSPNLDILFVKILQAKKFRWFKRCNYQERFGHHENVDSFWVGQKGHITDFVTTNPAGPHPRAMAAVGRSLFLVWNVWNHTQQNVENRSVAPQMWEKNPARAQRRSLKQVVTL